MIGARRIAVCLMAALLSLLARLPAQAHESRPAYLEIKETAPNRYGIL